MMSVFLTFIALVPWAWSICETKCEPISSLLSDCSLPPISSAWADAREKERNLAAGSPWVPHYLRGPRTRFIANYSQAECFCVDARTEFTPCHRCWIHGDGESEEIKDELVTSDDYRKIQHIDYDCMAFGYFSDVNLTYPSTTLLSSVPLETAFPSEDEGDTLCSEMCGPMRAHVEACNLTSIDAGDWPDDTPIPENKYSYEHKAAVLLNRTAAECLCTLQVLRHAPGCSRCLSVKEEETAMPNLKWRADEYHLECAKYGYWTDLEWILPPFDEFHEDKPMGSLTSTGHSPSPTDDSGVGGSVSKSMGLTASGLFAGLLFLF